MRRRTCGVLWITVSVASLAGCHGSQALFGTPGAMPQASTLATRANTSNYKVIYSFGSVPDGSYPRANLVDVGGTLYGTTSGGGSNTCGYSSSDYFPCGTVFSITTSGSEKVLYSFDAPPDGNSPAAGLLDMGGTLYGTTMQGGSITCVRDSTDYGCGTVFSITTSGAENVLYSFKGSPKDGVRPEASLIDVKGAMYSTTDGGGTYGSGTVFSVTPGGAENVLRSFMRPAHYPVAGLIDAGGTLYGTTHEGGAKSCGRTLTGCGTVFSLTLDGRLKVLHLFGSKSDGRLPSAGLIEVKGTFYGTTVEGGTHDDGTVFSISPGGSEKMLYSFSGSDGKNPEAGLIAAGGMLYGTTYGGGAHGNGTLFSISMAGAEKVLHSFGGDPDGANPSASLIDVNRTLYGTTTVGGSNGYGTVFAFTP